MATIRPFQGVRYDPAVAGNLSDVVSPPYDVISPADRVRYHEKHPYNFVRLILGEERPEDDERQNRFTRAKEYLDDWLRQGIFKRDETPAIYVYEQEYARAGRILTIRGFTLLVRIEDYDKRIIMPHENTLAKPKSNLIRLMRATQANFDSIYSLYPDSRHVLMPILDEYAAKPPIAEAADRDSVRHRLWVITSEAQIRQVADFLSDKDIVIADGHHRYETSMAYRDEMRRRNGPAEGDRPYDYTLMTIVNVYSRDVTIFPTHRMVGNLPAGAAKELPKKLAGRFRVESADGVDVTAAMAERDGAAIGLVMRDAAYLLTLRGEAPSPTGRPTASSRLDLTILHEVILEDALGIDEDKLKHETNVVYTRDEREAISRVKTGEFEMAFLLNPVRVESVLEVAREGEKMPQKATYFYPKLISGLALRTM